MVRYVLWTVYNSFLDTIILLEEAETNTVCGLDHFVTFRDKIRHFARLAIFGAIFLTMFSLKALCLVV